jgi:hypothetical protein
MKNYLKIAGIICLIFAINSCDSSDESIPEKTKADMLIKYPNAGNIRWEEKSADLFTVKFTESQEGEFMAVYNKAGDWIETKHFLAIELVPTEVKTYADSTYLGSQLESLSLLTKPRFEGYEMEVRHDGNNIDLVFDLSGKFIGSEIR